MASRQVAYTILHELAPREVYLASSVTLRAVSSYLTFSPSPPNAERWKFQCLKLKFQTSTNVLIFKHCDLFVFWRLLFEISPALRAGGSLFSVALSVSVSFLIKSLCYARRIAERGTCRCPDFPPNYIAITERLPDFPKSKYGFDQDYKRTNKGIS